MKKIILFVFVIYGSICFGQVSFLGFDAPICSCPMSYSYTYQNYATPGGPTSMCVGYRIYRNGTQIYDMCGVMGMGANCNDLVFINDSTGFILISYLGGLFIQKTSDYGKTWVGIGGGGGFFSLAKLYVLNENFAYLILYSNTSFSVIRCSDIESISNFLNDTVMTSDIFTTDTILNNILCHNNSLKIIMKNNLDTITYHVNITSIPTGSNTDCHPLDPNIYIYPNPTDGKFMIKFNQLYIHFKLEIYSVLGQKIVSEDDVTYDGKYNVDADNLTPGLYYISVIANNQKQKQKLLIQKPNSK